MKRLKLLFAVVLLLLALPLWRLMDILVLMWAGELLYALAFFFWGTIFLALPAWLIKPKLFPAITLGLVLIGSIVSYNKGPISSMTSKDPAMGHCGPMTYAGMFYPLHEYLTHAHADDLEAKNQLCWVKKMIQRVPENVTSMHEIETYLKLTQDKLLMPENKFRVSLPLIALLYVVVIAKYEERGPVAKISSGKIFVESLKFWSEQYTVEVSSRDYSWVDFPHGPYIQFEYGLIERNWEKIIENIVNDEK